MSRSAAKKFRDFRDLLEVLVKDRGAFAGPRSLLSRNTQQVSQKVPDFLMKAARDIFLKHKINLNPRQLETVALALQKAIKEASEDQAFAVKNTLTHKTLTEETLRELVGQRMANVTVGPAGDEILVMGYGNMASAIVKGQGPDAKVTAVVRDTSKARGEENGVSVSYVSNQDEEYRQILTKYHPGNFLLSVKPQAMQDEKFVDDLGELRVGGVVISVVAGVKQDFLKKSFQPGTQIVRVMPNTPLAVGYGVSACFFLPDSRLSEDWVRSQVMQYFGQGNNKCIFVQDESMIDKVTALSGSGPAYALKAVKDLAEKSSLPGFERDREKQVFDMMRNAFEEVDIATYVPINTWEGSMEEMIEKAYTSDDKTKDFIICFAKALYKKALAFGFSQEDAKTLSVGTFRGAGEYGFLSNKDAKTLREEVTSPKGTTFAALEVLANEKQAGSLSDLVAMAVQAAANRAKELGELANAENLPQRELEAGPDSSVGSRTEMPQTVVNTNLLSRARLAPPPSPKGRAY